MGNDLISRKVLMQSLRNNVLVDVTPNLEQAVEEQPAIQADEISLLKGVLMAAGPQAVEDFISGDLEHDEQEGLKAMNRMLDHVIDQMPEKDLKMYIERYLGSVSSDKPSKKIIILELSFGYILYEKTDVFKELDSYGENNIKEVVKDFLEQGYAIQYLTGRKADEFAGQRLIKKESSK